MKDAFLMHVAEDLVLRHGRDLDRVVVVSPNRRMRLFMNEYLTSLAYGAMWAPRYLTIDELYGDVGKAAVCEPIPAVIHLYDIYRRLTGEDVAESMDRFWGWGEIMLQDFDDIDKHLVNAHELFLNARQLGEMDSLEFLTENQRQALERFFGSFSQDRTLLQERFMRLWEIMPGLYDGIRDVMPEGMAAYAGALQRMVVEDKDLLRNLPEDVEYCFVGFNMLCETDKVLMRFLQGRGQAVFYWDYDVMYLEDDRFEAGDFIRENLKLFPNRLSDKALFDNLRKRTDFTFVATSTDSIGTRYIPEWLGRHLTSPERETAIVLCDEGQLLNVLQAIPSEGLPRDMNITMGYPLRGTPVFGLVTALIALQTDGWDESRKRFRRPFLNGIEFHPYAAYMDREVWTRRIDVDDSAGFIAWLDGIVLGVVHEGMDTMMTESVYLTHRSLRQFLSMATDRNLPMRLEGKTLGRLMRRALGGLSIPFHGEPAEGVQVMGVLETRALDFRNILMLNTGEGFLPRTGMDASLIPNTIRIGYNLTTVRHRVAVFAYYFYRLIQRAGHVSFVFNRNSAGVVHHEMSRFLRQLLAETDIPIGTVSLEAAQEVSGCMIDVVEKDGEIMERLHRLYDRRTNRNAQVLSPTSINRYLDCPMKFYLQNLCGLRVESDPEDGIDAMMMGTVFHDTMQEIYTEICSHTKGTDIIGKQALTTYIENDGLRNGIMDRQFSKTAGIDAYRGENILIRNVVERYLVNTLRYDCRRAPFVMKGMEKDFAMMLTVETDGGKGVVEIMTGGRVDRIDIVKDGDGVDVLRIIDYKTGAPKPAPSKMDDLFKAGRHSGYYLQTFLYAIAVLETTGTQMAVQPALLYASRAGGDGYEPVLTFESASGVTPVQDIREYREDFTDRLKTVVREIFDPNVPFTKTKDREGACQFCDLRSLCGIKEKGN